MRPPKRSLFSAITWSAFLSLQYGSLGKEPVGIALGADHEGRREIMGFSSWGRGESAHAWLKIFEEIRKRNAGRIDIVVPGGLPGMKESSGSVSPPETESFAS